MPLTFVTLGTVLAMLATSQWVVFSQRIANYMELRERAAGEVGEPHETDDPRAVSRTTNALANQISVRITQSGGREIVREQVVDVKSDHRQEGAPLREDTSPYVPSVSASSRARCPATAAQR